MAVKGRDRRLDGDRESVRKQAASYQDRSRGWRNNDAHGITQDHRIGAETGQYAPSVLPALQSYEAKRQASMTRAVGS